MSMSLSIELLEEVALVKSGISEAFIEKDWFVTKVISILSENQYLDYSIVFTGGTSLSKAHKLIDRFSEDIDFRLMAPSLEREGASKVRKLLSDFKNHVTGLLEKEFEILAVDARDGNRHIMINLGYPSLCEPAEVLRPHIKLEFTLSKLILPSIELAVSSFINEETKQAPEVAKIPCINPVENAADKLSAIVWRIPSRVRGQNDKQPDVVRHLHDLAKLSDYTLKDSRFIDLAKSTIEQDDSRAEQIKGLSTKEKLSKVIEILESDPYYPQEYSTYVSEMVYNHDVPVPTFKEAVEKLKNIIRIIDEVN